ncbi:hypothetical protein [Catenulispora pinisilvae]|uniref:hypothetical protein n=1 Tax=Catenulispora pinisilvae TaxID=2705253 RepID=UPI001891C2EF|nr:hypothetical protein [Catenulispora pinisilvae]
MRARLGLAAAIAAPVGILSALFSPLARRPLRWGRRFYQHLADRARVARERRNAGIEQQHQVEAEQAAAPENTELPATTTPTTRRGAVDMDDLLALMAAVAAGTTPNTPSADSLEGADSMEFFDFRQQAEDMYKAAVNGEAEGPGAMMRVLNAFATMPETLELIAKTFEVVAQRCDDELPLDPGVTGELEHVRTLIRSAATAAESIEPTFRVLHEADIARHEDPRTGEDKWDVGPGGADGS